MSTMCLGPLLQQTWNFNIQHLQWFCCHYKYSLKSESTCITLCFQRTMSNKWGATQVLPLTHHFNVTFKNTLGHKTWPLTIINWSSTPFCHSLCLSFLLISNESNMQLCHVMTESQSYHQSLLGLLSFLTARTSNLSLVRRRSALGLLRNVWTFIKSVYKRKEKNLCLTAGSSSSLSSWLSFYPDRGPALCSMWLFLYRSLKDSLE